MTSLIRSRISSRIFSSIKQSSTVHFSVQSLCSNQISTSSYKSFSTTSSTVTPKINMQLVKALRDSTGAPMMECKDAIVSVSATMSDKSADEILTAATDVLRKKGVATAAKKAGRSATEGLVTVRVTADRRQGTLVEVNSETDFCSRNERFQQLVVDIGAVAVNIPAPSTAGGKQTYHILHCGSSVK